MGRYTFPAFGPAKKPHYVVVWDLQWQLVECRRLEAAADLPRAMAAAIERLEGDGWHAEGRPEYGFVFIRREHERRLLVLTHRDPASTAPQSFNPFGEK